MPTEKGRYKRLNAERAMLPPGTAWSERWDRAYVDRKYARLEKNTKRSHETNLPETRKLTGRQIRERLGTANPAAMRLIPECPETLVPMHPCQYYPVTKRALNMPDSPPDMPRNKQGGTVYDSTVHNIRDGKRRSPLPDTTGKAKKQADTTSVMRRAWKNMDEATKQFVKMKAK